MYFTMSSTAYDAMDGVVVTVSLRSYDEQAEKGELVLLVSDTIRGRGESDPRKWARDALVAMLEHL